MGFRACRRIAGGSLLALAGLNCAFDGAPAHGADSQAPAAGNPRLAHARAEVERRSDELMATGQIVGLATVVVGGGEVASARGLGRTEAGIGTAVGPDTVFRFASLSKSFASTLVTMLADEGYLSLDARVQDLVPVFELADSRQARAVTVRDLLSHRVGLPYNALDRQLESDEPYPLLVYRLRELPMLCRAGDCYAYQNVAFSLVGDVAFATSGDFYSYQVERRLFHPLGMASATFGREALEANPDHARPHVRKGTGWQTVRAKETYYRVMPAAGVNASVRDLGAWLNAQLGHRPDVIAPQVLATIHSNVVHTPSEARSSQWRRDRLVDAHYALGWRVFDYGGHKVLFHGGAVQGYRAMMAIVPESDAGIGILWNSESALPSGLLPTFLDALLAMPARDWLELDRLSVRRPVIARSKRPARRSGS
jgi:beta-lactamase class C